MNASLLALLGFAAWILVLIVITIFYRAGRVFSGQLKADAWTRGESVEDPPVFKRIGDAHANCLEMLPIVGVVILAAVVGGAASVTNGLALWFLAARVGQSVSHIISVHHLMIFFVRFPLFLVQVAILIYWLLALAHLV